MHCEKNRYARAGLVAGALLVGLSAVPSKAALVTNYKFDGNANDSAGSANLTASTTTGAPTFSSTGASSQTGGSAVFSGAGDFNIASSKVFQSTPNFSVSLWVDPSSAAALPVVRQDSNGPGGFALLIDSNGYDAFLYTGTGSASTSIHGTTASFTANAWTNVILTFADPTGATDTNGAYIGTAKLYLNGSLITTSASNIDYSPGGSTNAVGIGGRGTGTSGNFVGGIDDFAVFNNVLSSSDISTIAGGAPAASLSSVPEPASMALLGLGSLVALRRRQSI